MFIPGQVRQVIIFAKGLQQGQKIVVFRDIQLGDVAAAESEVLINVVGQSFQLLLRLPAGQQGDGSAVAADEVRVFSKVILKIAGGVIAAGGDIGVAAVESFGKPDPFGGCGVGFCEVFHQVPDQDVVFSGWLDELMVA